MKSSQTNATFLHAAATAAYVTFVGERGRRGRVARQKYKTCLDKQQIPFCISISYVSLTDYSLFLFEIQVSLGILHFLLLNLAIIKEAKTIFTVNVL